MVGVVRPAALLMKQITKEKSRKLYTIPQGMVWPIYFFFLVMILGMLGSSIGWILAGDVVLGSVTLVVYSVLFYFLSTFFLTLPIRMGVQKQISARHYFAMEAHHRRAIMLVNKLHLPKDDNYASLLINIGLAQMQQGKYREAEATYIQAIEETDNVKLKNKWIAILARLNYAAVLVRSQRLHEALELYDACEKKLPELPQALHVYQLIIALGRARALTHYDAWDEAEALCLQSNELLQANKDSPFLKSSLVSMNFGIESALALICAKQKRMDESIKHFNNFMELAQAKNAADVNSGFTLAQLGDAYLDAGDNERAERTLEFAYEQARNYPLHPDAQRVQSSYARLLEATGRSNEIADMRTWIRHTPEALLA
jgi:tetratricopeptide (TPR) repeat protein